MNFSSYAPPLPLALTLQSVCNNFVNSQNEVTYVYQKNLAQILSKYGII